MVKSFEIKEEDLKEKTTNKKYKSTMKLKANQKRISKGIEAINS